MEKNQKNNKICEICEEMAICVCFNCNSYYCDSCFKYIHDKKVNREHKKEKIDYFVPIDTKCPEHPKIPMNIYCLDENGKNTFLFLFFNILKIIVVQFAII